MKKLLIIGASGHGKVVANIAHDCGDWNEISFLDDDLNKVGSSLIGFNIIDTTANLELYIDDYEFVVGIGDAYVREEVTHKLLEMGAYLSTLIHPSAVIGLDVKIDQGTVLMPMCVVNSSSTIGLGCIINTGSTVDHDCELGAFVHVSPGSTIAGTVKIGSRTWIGTGARIINNLSVFQDCTIAAGAVVVKSINSPGLYIGIPAREVIK
ncbi:acetyltransferase [Exiguobacterium aurantiacum]|uniref:2,3,4,5-tetrahydropyridine-2,6-dicarboxylate N-acetyltransferase n=1 Tax=Exiguobacterium aurantiacum TaxID=33987 RepID=A0A377FS00_9BACL|nr:acetyltransferase [Exiguobacterium aurantiacum]STO07245.1 2,3,4,5-tetrahydropyridine-2,6-dicarboxylate N-acetyltransferase [Exiguobacterium aurantiacum]